MTLAAVALALTLVGDLTAQQLPTAIPQTKFVSGQNVVPYFEGWIRNADGSFDLVFGYFNRNWQEELAIAAGPDNIVEPGAPDRGQPTYFLPRRQGWVFRVRVPKDFGKQVLTWTVKANGKTEKAYGELLPVEEITSARLSPSRCNWVSTVSSSRQNCGCMVFIASGRFSTRWATPSWRERVKQSMAILGSEKGARAM